MRAKGNKNVVKKVAILVTTIVFTISTCCITASAGMLGSDTVSSTVYGTTATGNLYVYDTYAYANTSYGRSGSNISLSATVVATYRYGGDDIYLSDYDNTSGGGAEARVELSLSDYPNAVFLDVDGQHEVRNYVNGALLQSGHWLDFTNWTR